MARDTGAEGWRATVWMRTEWFIFDKTCYLSDSAPGTKIYDLVEYLKALYNFFEIRG